MLRKLYSNTGLILLAMTKEWRIIFTLPAIAMIASCTARAVYYDHEKDLARLGVERFHEYYNRNDYDALYLLLSAGMRKAQSKDTMLPAMQTTFGNWGKSESSTVVIGKVYPGSPVQVRTIYNTSFEKGKAQEWFIWASDGKEASLMQYQVFPGWADPEKVKADISK
jgi:hypothetical protein